MYLQILLNGLVAGAVYSLVASGFSLIYSTCRFIHFAHGTAIIFVGYLFYWLFKVNSVNFWLACLICILFSILLGLLINEVYRKLRRRKASATILLVASFGIMVLLESLIIMIYGTNIKTISNLSNLGLISVFGSNITILNVIMVVAALLVLGGFFLLMKKTRIGKAIRAVSDNKSVSEILGISSEKIYAWTFVLSSFIAAVASILICFEFGLKPTMGTNFMVKGFTASVIGGIDNVKGAIVGAFILGFVENIAIWFLPSGYKDAIAYTILFLFLLFRPQGIFQTDKRYS